MDCIFIILEISLCGNILGPVVQKTSNPNPGLKLNPLCWFVYFRMSIYFKNFHVLVENLWKKYSYQYTRCQETCTKVAANPGLNLLAVEQPLPSISFGLRKASYKSQHGCRSLKYHCTV